MSALVPRLELRQGQSLMMTQQLQQSIKLLQMSSLELAEFVDQELEKNPLLEQSEDNDNPVEDEAPGENEDPADSDVPDPEYEADTVTEDPAFEWENYDTPIKSSGALPQDSENAESWTATEISLRDFLLEQLHLEINDPAKHMIGQHLIDMVDEDGYIRDDISAIALLLDSPQALIEQTLVLLQGFEPAGVCARNLSECLAIQLREKDRLDPAMLQMLSYLPLVAAGDVRQLSCLCGVDQEDVRQMCAEIRALNPRPGSGFNHEKTDAVIPDVFLRRTGAVWNIELNSASLPRVMVNRKYYTEISGKTMDRTEKKYLSEQFGNANWLLKALDSRAQTILKVSREIVRHQENFFLYGIRDLRPLTLKEVADAVGLHESTVSRVTASKYMMTPRGIYELKYFFSAAISNMAGGEGYSSKSVQYMIRQLIDQETGNTVVSDDAIAEILEKRGIEIARRTVAKYRELMKIPSSSVRKRQKNSISIMKKA